MSKLVVASYRVSDAERREVQRKIALIRATLKRLAALRDELARLEPVAEEDWANTLAQYDAFEKDDVFQFTGVHNRLEDALPGVAEKLEKALGEARAKRTRLELTAATLMALGASPEEKAVLGALDARSATLYADAYKTAAARVEAILRKRLDTPLNAPDEAGLTSAQLALAAELLAGSGPSETPSIPGAPAKLERHSPDAARINKLVAQIGGLDTTLASFDDLLEQLRQIPAIAPAQRALLIDSIEIAAGQRLNDARRKREVRNTIDDGLASLAPFASLTADEHRRRLEVALAADNLDTARSVREEALKWAKEEAHRQDGARVRAALVAELQGLGYEVNVQAEAWNEGRSITAARPNEPNYDVQLGAAPGGKIQSKVRAYDHAGRSAGVNRRDVEVEQSWCDDLARLNKLLAERGIGSDILREDGPGTTAQVPLPTRHDRGGDEPGRPIQRELK